MSALLANQTEYRFSTGIARAGQLFKTGLMSSPAAMATDSVSSDARPRKSVRFAGTKCIGYDAELPVVVHYGGVGRQPWDQNHAADTTLPYTSLLLEAQARDLYVVSDEDKQSPRAQPDPRDLCQRLDREYARELLEELRTRGLTPLIQAAADEDDDATAAASCADLKQLRAQLCVADLVYALAQVRSARSGEEDETSELDSFNAQQLLVLLEDAKGDTKRMNDVLGKLEFAKKGIEGLVDDGYVFGRRFLSVEAYVSTLSHPELFELAEQRSLTLPALSESDIAKLKVSDRDLRGAYSTGAGKQLKKLTLRELVVEAQARDIEIKDARDANGKKSKKAWVAKLKVCTEVSGITTQSCYDDIDSALIDCFRSQHCIKRHFRRKSWRL